MKRREPVTMIGTKTTTNDYEYTIRVFTEGCFEDSQQSTDVFIRFVNGSFNSYSTTTTPIPLSQRGNLKLQNEINDIVKGLEEDFITFK